MLFMPDVRAPEKCRAQKPCPTYMAGNLKDQGPRSRSGMLFMPDVRAPRKMSGTKTVPDLHG